MESNVQLEKRRVDDPANTTMVLCESQAAQRQSYPVHIDGGCCLKCRKIDSIANGARGDIN
jgi:hypothetical protein